MLFLSGKYEWIPLYAWLLYLLIRKFKKESMWIIIGVIATVVLTDQISVKLFKEVFERLRPCHEESIAHLVHVVRKCGGQFGFVSSHACNTFGVAAICGLFLRKHYSWILWALLGWALIVSYSRIYLGVHYPGDIICGGLLGFFIGWLIFRTTNVFVERNA